MPDSVYSTVGLCHSRAVFRLKRDQDFTEPVGRAEALHFYMFTRHDNFKSYFLIKS